MQLRGGKSWWLAVMMAGLACGAGSAAAQGAGAQDVQREQREQIEQWRRQALRPADLPDAAATAVWLPPVPGEQPCVHLSRVRIAVAAEAGAGRAPAVPWQLQEPPSDFLDTCVGLASLQRLRTNLQGRLQALGFITSTLSLAEQDLQAGALQLQLHWGRVGQVRIELPDTEDAARNTPAPHALALQPGEVLNLRDIEHTLENLARLPSQAARFVIEPSSAPNSSDLRIVISSQRRWRASLGLDAADVRRHSPWDAQAQAWLDAPLGWSDQLMLSASGTPEAAGEQRTRRHSLYAMWSLPWGRHLVSLSASTARNSRSIAGGVGRFAENGEEDQATLRWQWTPWRGADWRTQVWTAWSERRSRSLIDDVELLSRRRVASDLSLGASHWHRLGCGEASVELEATQTRRLARVADFQDQQAPMPRQWRVQAEWRCAWPQASASKADGSADAPWSWAVSAWSQAVERPFDGTDLLTLGSRYTVRGHSPEQALQGQRISVARFSATAPGQQSALGLSWQPWLSWDLGRVERLAATTPAGADLPRSRQAAVLGLRWQAGNASGDMSWARAIGASPVPRSGQWQAQAAWQF